MLPGSLEVSDMAKIEQQIIVFDGSTTKDICSATFQDVCVLPSGRILVSFRGGPQKGPINKGENGYYCISDDGGKTWTEAKAPFGTLKIDGGEGRARGFQLLALGGNQVFGVMSLVEEIGEELPYFNEKTEAIKNTQLYTFFSDDGGETFSQPQRIEMKSKYRGLSCVLTSPPLLLKDGRIMVNFEVYKTYYDEGPFSHHAACIFSSDGGKTWGEEVTIREKRPLPVDADETMVKIYGILSEVPIHVDEIAAQTQKNPAEVLTALSELEIMGFVSANAGRRFSIS